MKFALFLIVLGTFVLNTLNPVSAAMVGVNLINGVVFAVGMVLLTIEVISGRLYSKTYKGVGLAVTFSVAVVLSLYYANLLGVYGGSWIENARFAKSMVIMPALLYGMAFLLIDTREQGMRYLMVLVAVLGATNVAYLLGGYTGVDMSRTEAAYRLLEEPEQRMGGFTGNPNKTAYLVCVLVAFQYYFYKFHPSRAVRYLMAALMIAGLAIVLQSGSRGGLVVLVVLVGALAFRLRDMRVIYTTVMLVPALVGLLMYMEVEMFTDSMQRIANLMSGDAVAVTTGRSLIWPALLEDYTESVRGMIFGNGFGSAYYMGIGASPHNVYLKVLVEFGLLGFLFFLYAIFSMFRYVVRREGPESLKASILAAGAVVVFAWMFTTLVGVLAWLWFTIGVAMATLLRPETAGRVRSEGTQAWRGVGQRPALLHSRRDSGRGAADTGSAAGRGA